jgi:hypothetical protein
MEWLARPLECSGVVVLDALDPARLSDSDLLSICLRMNVIFNTIEMQHCEGRHMPLDLSDDLDTLESMVVWGHRSPHGHPSPPRLAEWSDFIRKFGEHYQLAGSGAITVNPAIYQELAERYTIAAIQSLENARLGSLGPLNALGELPTSHAGRTRFLPEADRSVIASIRLGVLFVMAFWSGTSRQGFVQLKNVLAAVDPTGRLELVVVDTDGCPDLYEAPEFAGNMHGHGEVAWVRNGRVVLTSGSGFHPECFEPNTRHLLQSADERE